MTRKLFIHAGPPKTGTSALQFVLRAHDGSVAYYPKAGQWGDGAHHNLVLNFFGDYSSPEVIREDTGALFARIAAGAVESQGPIVISSEMLSLRSHPGEFIDALIAHLGGELDVEILFVVRQHFERAASLYGHHVRSDVICEKRGPDEYLAKRTSLLCYAPMLRRLRETKHRIWLIDYGPAETLIPRILRHIGFPDDRIAAPPTRNPSHAIKVLLATLAANRAAGTRRDRNNILQSLGKLGKSHTPAQFIFGREAARAAETKFGADRAFLREQFQFAVPAPDLAAMENAFWIDKRDFTQIAARVAGLGDVGERLREALRTFVRTPLEP